MQIPMRRWASLSALSSSLYQRTSPRLADPVSLVPSSCIGSSVTLCRNVLYLYESMIRSAVVCAKLIGRGTGKVTIQDTMHNYTKIPVTVQ